MPIEFQVLTLRIQATKRLDELQSEQIRKEGLLLLGESRRQAMIDLEWKQRQMKALVDRHCRQVEKLFAIGNWCSCFKQKWGVCLGSFDFDGRDHSGLLIAKMVCTKSEHCLVTFYRNE